MSPFTPQEVEALQPITVFGSNISYFTGKLENYLRLKGIDYRFQPMQFPHDKRRLEQAIGVMQMPAVQLGDGRWLTDTTPMIQWFEAGFPEHPIMPRDPLLRFLCLLIEDYADEWLWRPAMHYRWHYEEGAHLQSRHLADEVLGPMFGPGFLKRWVMRRRQRGGYTRGDGITATNVPGVEAIYLNLLDTLQGVFSDRSFVFGSRPSLADIGLSGPFFRHFALDPVPLEILRQRAPAVLEWVARLWNTRLAACDGEWVSSVPSDLQPLLADIGQAYLPYLNANAAAVAAGQQRFDAVIDGVDYRGARYSRYRVWCLSRLREEARALSPAVRDELKSLLEGCGAWEPLWSATELPLLPGQEAGLPFRADTKMVGVNE